MYQQYQSNYQANKVGSTNLITQTSSSRLQTEEGQEDLARVEQFIWHLKNGKQVSNVPRQNIRDSNTFQTSVSGKQSMLAKSNTSSQLMSPINNIRDIQQKLQNADTSTTIGIQQITHQNIISNPNEDQKQFVFSEHSSVQSQPQNQQNYQAQQYLQVSKHSMNVGNASNINGGGANSTVQNGSMNYQIPIMTQNQQQSSPYQKVKNISQLSVSNSTVQLGRSPKYDRDTPQTNLSANNINPSSYSNNNINVNEEQMKNQINYMTSEIVHLTEKLQRMEGAGKKQTQRQSNQNQKKNNKRNTSSDSSSSNTSSSNSSSSSRDGSEKSKQMRKQQENEIERFMQQYLNYVHVDRYQLNLFRDSYISENNFYKLKDSKDYKTLFHKTLIVLIQNLEKIKPLVVQSSVLYANGSVGGQNSLSKNNSTISGITLNAPNQPLLSHANSTAQLSNNNLLSSDKFASSTNLLLSKIQGNGIPTASLITGQNEQQIRDLKKSQLMNGLSSKIQKQFGNMINGRNPEICQTERGAYSGWESNTDTNEFNLSNQNFMNQRGNYYMPNSRNGMINDKSTSPAQFRSNLTSSISQINGNQSYDMNMSENMNGQRNAQSNQVLSKHGVQKTFSFMPRDQSNIGGYNSQQKQDQINYRYNQGNSHSSAGMSVIEQQQQLLQSRESFGVNIKSSQHTNGSPKNQAAKSNGKGQSGMHKKNLKLEDIPDEVEMSKSNNIESARFKYSQSEINEKMRIQSQHDEDYPNNSSKRNSYHNSKKLPQSSSSHYNSNYYSNDQFSKSQISQQQYSPQAPYYDEYTYTDVPDHFSHDSERERRHKNRDKSRGKPHNNDVDENGYKKSSTLNEIDMDDQYSVTSKNSKMNPNDENGRHRFYTANSSKMGNEDRLRNSQMGRISTYREGKKEQPPITPTEQCTHQGCPGGSCCLHVYGPSKTKKDRQSHFFKNQERAEKIIPDITQIPKRAKPAISVQKTQFDIITNNIQSNDQKNN